MKKTSGPHLPPPQVMPTTKNTIRMFVKKNCPSDLNIWNRSIFKTIFLNLHKDLR
jgi:hypothetical protein